jgi:hypothetical protein
MKESSFVREVENRLDVLFGIGLDPADRGRNAGPDPVDPRAILDGIRAETPAEDGGDGIAAAVADMDDRLNAGAESPEPDPDRRYHILLEEEVQEPLRNPLPPIPVSRKSNRTRIAGPGAAEDGDRRFEQIFGDIETVTPALFSPSKP